MRESAFDRSRRIEHERIGAARAFFDKAGPIIRRVYDLATAESYQGKACPITSWPKVINDIRRDLEQLSLDDARLNAALNRLERRARAEEDAKQCTEYSCDEHLAQPLRDLLARVGSMLPECGQFNLDCVHDGVKAWRSEARRCGIEFDF